MRAKMAAVLVAVLVIGTFGGIGFTWDTCTEGGPGNGITDTVDFDGGDTPSDPDGIPSDDPEHPQ